MNEEAKLLLGARRHVTAMVLCALATCAAVSCTPGEKQVAKSVIDVASMACVFANADLPDSSAIAAACSIEQALAPDIKKIVDDFKSRRAAFAREQMAAQHCAK